MSPKKLTFAIVSFIILVSGIAFADWKEDAEAIKVSGGEDYTLVLTQNKWLWAGGDNGYYQLGIGDTKDDRWTLVRVHGPNDVGYLEDINDMDAGWMHSLALDANGFVWAWGNNDYGQLGDPQVDYATTPVRVHGPNDVGYLEDIIAIATGRSGAHSLAVDANNFVWAWGDNRKGQLGIGSEDDEKHTPVQVVGGEMETTWLEDIVEVSAGEDNSIARDANGSVWTWGNNDYGQLGNASNADYNDTPVQVLSGQQDPCDPNSFLQNIVVIDSGWDHLLALEKYDPCDPFEPNYDPNYGLGYVYAWGRNKPGSHSTHGGQLGDGTTDNNSVPVKVLSGEQDPCDPNPYLKYIVAVSAGEAHSMALDVNGNVWTWGDNSHDQLGNGTNDPCSLTPVKVVGLNGEGYLGNIVAISVGYWHSIAIDSDGTVWTWGWHNEGRLGLGSAIDENDSNTPHPIGVVYNLTQETFHFSLQPAIDDANNSEDILKASPATYFEDVDFLTKTITLRSTDPNNWDIVADTIINHSKYGVPAVKFANNPNSILTGFTVTSNYYGIECNSSSPEISNCIVENCGGHGLYCLGDSSANLTNTKILSNGKSGLNDDGINCSSSEIILSNCIIEDNDKKGIYCNDSDVNIVSCIIEGNGAAGVYCNNSDFNIIKCIIEDNSGDGIHNQSSSAFVTNSIIRRNDNHGIYFHANDESKIEMKNNWIHNNGAQGISIDDAFNTPVTILNNTIVNNATYGIRLYLNDLDVSLSNCIVWKNGTQYGDNLVGTFKSVTYSCIEGDTIYPGDGNINSDPLFYNPNDPNDYHLGPNSPCIDEGDPNFEQDPNETDIDGEPRVVNGRVDMGADEYDYRDADFNGDGVVNFLDYAVFANAWQTRPGDDNYNEDCNLVEPNSIDYNDLALFCEDWLWEAGWTKTPPCGCGMGQGMGRGSGLDEGLYSVAVAQQPPAEVDQLNAKEHDIEELINWLEELWLDDEVRKIISEDEWQEFIEAVKGGI